MLSAVPFILGCFVCAPFLGGGNFRILVNHGKCSINYIIARGGVVFLP